MTVCTLAQHLTSTNLGQQAITCFGRFFKPCFCVDVPIEPGLESLAVGGLMRRAKRHSDFAVRQLGKSDWN